MARIASRRRLIDKQSLLLNMPGEMAKELDEVTARLRMDKTPFIREAISRHLMSFRHWLNEQERRVDRGL